LNQGALFLPFRKPLLRANFLGRPQRFRAEMQFPDGTKTVAYCANPGSLNGCLQTGSAALLWDSKNPKRKRRFTWRAIKVEGVWVGTDTHLANRLVEQALHHQLLPSLRDYELLQSERRVEAGLRMDFVLTGARGSCFLEVKSATVVENGIARFPDSITPRGLKHLRCLIQKTREGHRAVMLFVVQRNDVKYFTVSKLRYPAYAGAFQDALAAGVETLAFAVRVSPAGFGHPRLLPVLHV
jgi:sugar fermentation stimulation protein A